MCLKHFSDFSWGSVWVLTTFILALDSKVFKGMLSKSAILYMWKISFFWVQRHHFHSKRRSFPPPNQAKTKNPGTSSALKSGYPEEYCALKTGYPEKKLMSVNFFSGEPIFSAQYLSGSQFSVLNTLPRSLFSVHNIIPGSLFSVHC